MLVIEHIDLDFALDYLDLSEDYDVSCIRKKLADETYHANKRIRATRKGQYAGLVIGVDENGQNCFEISFKSPYEYFGCFKTLYNWILSESDPQVLSHSISSVSSFAFHRPVLLSVPAGKHITSKHAEAYSEKIADRLCECVVGVHSICMPELIQNKGVFTAVATKLLEDYQYILIMRVVNKDWACTLKRIAVEVYVEPSGSNFLLDKESFPFDW
ncbi:hypothetical protein ACV17F_000685 [Vibrio harveyi]